jgi:hypothetical protein
MTTFLVALVLGLLLGYAARDVIAGVIEAVVRICRIALRVTQVALIAGGLVLIVQAVT